MTIGTGATIVGVLATLYGVGFAVMPKAVDGSRTSRIYTLGGALLILVAVVVLILIPWMGDRA